MYNESDNTQGTQTFNYPEKAKEIQTQDTQRVHADCLVNEWILYDAVADLQDEQEKTEAVDEYFCLVYVRWSYRKRGYVQGLAECACRSVWHVVVAGRHVDCVAKYAWQQPFDGAGLHVAFHRRALDAGRHAEPAELAEFRNRPETRAFRNCWVVAGIGAAVGATVSQDGQASFAERPGEDGAGYCGEYL